MVEDNALLPILLMLPYVLGSMLAACFYAVALWRAGFRVSIGLAVVPVLVAVFNGFRAEAVDALGSVYHLALLNAVLVLVAMTPLIVLALAPWPVTRGRQ